MNRLLAAASLLLPFLLLAAAPARAAVTMCAPIGQDLQDRSASMPSGAILVLDGRGCGKVYNSADQPYLTAQGYVIQADGSGGSQLFFNVVSYGADPTGAADSTSFIQAAITAATAAGNGCVYFPAGNYYITNAITVPNINACMFGDGRTLSVLKIYNTQGGRVDFNLSALGVFVLPSNAGNTGQGAVIHDLGFTFTQPDTAVRANIVAFPPAIYAQNHARGIVNNIRVSGGNTCLDARGNDGGWFLSNFECGSLTMGMEWDGALDDVHIHNFKVWDFGISAGLVTVYNDGNNTCASIGRVDGIDGVGLSCFETNIVYTSNSSASAGRHDWVNSLFDTVKWTQAGSGDGPRVYVSNSYFAGPRTNLTVNGGTFSGSNIDFISSQAAAIVNAAGGTLSLSGGRLYCGDSGVACATVSSGQLNMNNVFIPTGIQAFQKLTTAWIVQSGTGGLSFQNNWTDEVPQILPTSQFVKYNTDIGTNYYGTNNLPSWPVGFPATQAVGVYKSPALNVQTHSTDEAAIHVDATGAAPADIYFGQNGNSEWVLGTDVTDTFNIGYPANIMLTMDKTNTATLGKVAGTVNIVAGTVQVNGTSGVTCSGAPTGSFASTKGIVTHC